MQIKWALYQTVINSQIEVRSILRGKSGPGIERIGFKRNFCYFLLLLLPSFYNLFENHGRLKVWLWNNRVILWLLTLLFDLKRWMFDPEFLFDLVVLSSPVMILDIIQSEIVKASDQINCEKLNSKQSVINSSQAYFLQNFFILLPLSPCLSSFYC